MPRVIRRTPVAAPDKSRKPPTQIGQDFIAGVSPNRLVPLYLVASFLYYVRNDSVMTDSAYDDCCNRLHREWRNITHPHKAIIDPEALASTTGFYLKHEDYPSIIRATALEFLNHCENGTIYEFLSPSQSARSDVRPVRQLESAPRRRRNPLDGSLRPAVSDRLPGRDLLHDQSPAAAAQARVYPKQARPHIREALSALVTRMDFLFRRILHGHFSDAVRQVAGRMRPKQFLNVPAYYAGTVRPDLIVNGTNAETLSLVGLTLLTDHIISDMSMTGDPGTPAEYAQRILTSARDMNPELFHAA